MSILDKIFAARDAINAGEKLANSETWKKQAVAVSAITALLSAAKVFVPNLESVDAETLNQIGSGVYALYSVYVVFVTVATTDKIGLRAKRDK